MKDTRPTTKKAAVAYVRTATADTSVAGQEAHCRKLARENQAVIRAVYRDLGVSGTRSERPALSRLLRDISVEPIDYVITADASRLARGPSISADIAQQITAVGADVICNAHQVRSRAA